MFVKPRGFVVSSDCMSRFCYSSEKLLLFKEWEFPINEEEMTRSHRAKLVERQKIFSKMKKLQMSKVTIFLYKIQSFLI